MQLNLIINVLVAVIFALMFAILIIVEVYKDKLNKANERIATLERSCNQYRKTHGRFKEYIKDLQDRATAESETQKQK